MNVRKRGLALLMCICMIFTLLPFSALADATAKDGDIVYGTYGTDGNWQEDKNLNDTATYSLSGENALTLTKTATKTADNTYRIDLKVVMTQTTSTTPPGSAATVLVIDTSGSMDICATCNKSDQEWIGGRLNGHYGYTHKEKCKTGHSGEVEYADTRLAAAKEAAISFLDKYKGNSENTSRYVSVVAFNTEANVTNGWLDVSVPTNYTAVVNAINGLSANGGTNLDQALSKAKAQFSSDTVKDIPVSAKNVIALTDGCPTYYGNGIDQHGSYGCPDTNKATAKTATELKTVAGVYTVCFGAANEKCWTKDSAHRWIDHVFWIDVKEKHPTDGPKVGDFLKDSIATSASHAYNADNTTELMSAFEAITNTIVNGLKSGTVTDPMGDNVSLVGTAPSGFATNNNGRTYTWELSGAPGVTADGKTTYTYETSYTVKLDTSGDDAYHPLNGITTFTAAGKTYYFNVPGVYREAPKYTVTYQYDGDVPDGAQAQLPTQETYREGDTVTVKSVGTVTGWTFNGWELANDSTAVTGYNKGDTSFTMPAGDVKFVGTWSRNTANYTVRYYWNGQPIPGVDEMTRSADVGTKIDNISKNIDGYTVKDGQPTDFVVSATASENIITINYYKDVKVSAGIYEKNVGDDLTDVGATVVGVTDGTEINYTLTGVPKNSNTAGEYPLNVSGDEIQGEYKVTYIDGKLTIYDTYTVTYEYEYENGTDVPETVLKAPVDSNSPYREGSPVTVLNAPTDTIDGYIFDGWYIGTTKMDGKSFEIKSDTVIIGKWKPVTGLTCTINYIWNGKQTTPIRTVTIDGLTYNEVVKKSPMDIPGYTPVSNDSQEIVVKTTGNVINFYYYKNVTLESNSGTFTYDGKDHSVSGYDVITKADNGEDVKVDAEFSGVSASRTEKDIGSYPVTFKIKGDVVDKETLIGATDSNSYYIVSDVEEGTLTIEKIKDEVTVKITGNTKTVTYNGKEQNVEGYVADTNGLPITVSLATGKTAFANGTEVGTYKMNLAATDFVATSDIYGNIKIVIVEDGSLTITKRPLTIIGENSDPSEITYDGQTHTYTSWSLAPAADNSGLVSGHQITGITYLLTGKNAGDYTGQFSGDAKIMSGEEDVTANYSIEYAPGMMKIVPAEKIAVKIIGNHKEVWYNGQEQSVSGFTFEVADNTVTVELKAGHYAIAKGTNVKTYNMGLKSDDFTINHQNYNEVSVEIVDGYLTIKRHYTPNPPIMDEIIVEITGNSDSVVYDGTEHSVKDYTVKISDPRYTEKDFTFTGKAEASGVNAGTYEMGLKAEQFKNTNARFTNVKFVIKADGVLTITPKELTITAGSKTEYGPTPVTCDEWTVSGLAAGDKVESVKITGIQSVPGSSPNVPSDAVIKNAKGEDVTKNYAIKYVNGTLTMLEVLNKEDHFNYIIGTPEGLSLPTANVTRAEVATIFFRLMTDDARAKFDSLDNNFSDVAKGQWYNRAISTLANAGIIKGDPAGTYRPGDAITRAEMAAIIARFGDFKEGGKTFNDISGHWAQKYIELAASNGWINGNPDGTFKPNNNITRAETVAMINRVLDRQTKDVSDLLPVSQMTNWSDNMDTAKWYYRDMQEATNNHKAERVGNSIYEKWTEKLPDIDWASYQI